LRRGKYINPRSILNGLGRIKSKTPSEQAPGAERLSAMMRMWSAGSELEGLATEEFLEVTGAPGEEAGGIGCRDRRSW